MKFTVLTTLSLASVAFAATTTTNGYETYPSVPKTASVNGFADPMETAGLPDCADACIGIDTGITPCPYWDTGCLCVMSNWGGQVADCVADSCGAAEVQSFTQLASSVCSQVGVPSPYWFIPATASAALEAVVTGA